jgi:serine/threonine protein kinase
MNSEYMYNKSLMSGGGVISEGGYGCIFHPKIACSGQTTTNTKYISKIQRNNFFSRNEIYISSLIKKIPNYENFFNVILDSCDVSLKKISKGEIKKCDKTLKGISNALLGNLKYIKNKNLFSLLTERRISNEAIKNNIFIIINTYKITLLALEKLKKMDIIHNDIKPDNVLYDIDRNIPIIIDFGISIHKKQLTPETYKEHFYVFYPEYYVWCLDIHYICYLLHINKTPQKDEIEEICDSFVKHNPALRGFSDLFLKKYRHTCVKALTRYIGQDYLSVIKKLLKHTETWDLYSFSIIYLSILEYWYTRGFSDNSFIIDFSQLLLENIHPFPEKRNSIKETTEKFSGFFYTNTNNKNISDLINNVDDNYAMTRLNIHKEEKKLMIMSKKLITLIPH